MQPILEGCQTFLKSTNVYINADFYNSGKSRSKCVEWLNAKIKGFGCDLTQWCDNPLICMGLNGGG